jgi:hypothetical protein
MHSFPDAVHESLDLIGGCELSLGTEYLPYLFRSSTRHLNWDAVPIDQEEGVNALFRTLPRHDIRGAHLCAAFTQCAC